MASSATDSQHADKEIRSKLIDTGHVDVILSVGNNFFYTLTLPCTLWFFDKGKKAELKDRSKYVGGYKVQRDLYSAYLLKNSNTKFDKPDREKCIYGFENFLKLQNNLICEMKKNNISMKQCFGF